MLRCFVIALTILALAAHAWAGTVFIETASDPDRFLPSSTNHRETQDKTAYPLKAGYSDGAQAPLTTLPGHRLRLGCEDEPQPLPRSCRAGSCHPVQTGLNASGRRPISSARVEEFRSPWPQLFLRSVSLRI